MSLASLPSRVSVTRPGGVPEVVADPLNVGIVWDADNRLVEVKQGPTTLASFVYDGLGRRQQKIAAGVTHTYVSDDDNLLEERIGTGQTLRYVEGPEIDEHLAKQDGATISYYLADHLGSVVQETNSAGTATLARKYDPWGNLLAGTGVAGWAYAGREWDPEAGLHFYRARYFGAAIGRFLSEDPIGFRGGGNFYAYVDNNPSNLRDPQGLSSSGGMGVMLPLGPGPHVLFPANGECMMDCIKEKTGAHTAAAGAAAGASLPIIPKDFVTPGSSPGTSPMSKFMSKCFPQKLPYQLPTPTAANPSAQTRVLGRFLARWVGNVAWVTIIVDAVRVEICRAQCLKQRCSRGGDGCNLP